jgi:N-acetylmuramic acid 6-phosphate etherase
MELDRLDVGSCLRLINAEDATVAGAVERAIPAIEGFVAALESRMRAGGRLIYLGAGTSGRLGVLDASECPPTFCTEPGMVVGVIAGGDAALRRSSEGREDERDGAAPALEQLRVGPADGLLGIAAGGTTPFVLGGVEWARQRGALTGLLTCAPCGIDEAARVAQHPIIIDTGPEVLTGSTRMKAGTATKMALNMITTTVMVRLGKVYENLMVDVRATNDKLTDRAARIIVELTGASRERAFELLEEAGGSLKVGVVMQRRGLGAAEASELLARCDESLRAALDAEQSP